MASQLFHFFRKSSKFFGNGFDHCELVLVRLVGASTLAVQFLARLVFRRRQVTVFPIEPATAPLE
jgi:hypothetical protein